MNLGIKGWLLTFFNLPFSAIELLNTKEFEDAPLKARLVRLVHPPKTTPASSAKGTPLKKRGGPQGPPSASQRAIDFPLRILVHSEMVGAIIGRGGQTIKEITQQTR